MFEKEKFANPRKNAGRNYLGEQRPERKSGDPGMTRRHFLKNLGSLAITGAVLGGGYELGKMLDKLSRSGENVKNEKEKIAEEQNAEVAEKEEVVEKEQIFEPEEINFEEEDIEIMKKVFRPSVREELKINTEVIGVVTKYWIFQYQNRKKEELQTAYGEMQKMKPLLRDCFQKYNLPEELMYLAIPESGWRMDAISRSGAVGPYQFMPDTAKRYGLKNSKNPLESADACARLLRDLYEKSHDWDLALAGYNGGFFWDHIRECNEKNKKPSYDGFLSLLQRKMNEKRKEILKKPYFSYMVKEKEIVTKVNGVDRKNKRFETVKEISSRYHISLEQLKKFNLTKKENKSKKNKKKIKTEIAMFKGQKLIIPFNNQNRQIKFEEEAMGFIENINYPPKFNAVLECLGIRMAKYFSKRESAMNKEV